jgi:hypothetical protein
VGWLAAYAIVIGSGVSISTRDFDCCAEAAIGFKEVLLSRD